MAADPDRVRRHTAAAVLHCLDRDTASGLTRVADGGADDIHARLVLLEHEWDCDRFIEGEAATLGLLGVALAAFADRRWLALPALVASSVLLYATTGRHPLLPLLRRSGFRSAREIERERHALKALRGDFAMLDGEHAGAAGVRADRRGNPGDHDGNLARPADTGDRSRGVGAPFH